MSLIGPELEAIAADTIVGESRRARKHALPLGTPCPNCSVPLQGPWCHNCGQKGEDYHRSIWRLAGEAIEGLTEVDGRVWNTLPRLAFRPGKLTREYLEGHRASQIPPFRLFLIVLLIVFFAGGLNIGQNHTKFQLATPQTLKSVQGLSDSDRKDIDEAVNQIGQIKKNGPSVDIGSEGANRFWGQRLKRAVDTPDVFFQAVQEWGHRVAVLALPIAALMLTFLFPFKRGVYVFDHLVFTMHSLSFQGVLLSVMFLAGIYLDGVGWILVLAPVHLFVHMRGTYRTSTFGTLVRMFLLFIGSSVAFAILVLILFILGLATVR